MVPTRTKGETLARANDLGTGRLGTYAVMGAMLGTIPIPLIPDALGRRLRGALLYDVARRHGLSLAKDARNILTAPFAPAALQGTVGNVMSYAVERVLGRFGPLAVLGPFRSGAAAYVLGRLFHRYLVEIRDERAVRIDAAEAQKIRHAMEQAILRAISTPAPPEDLEGSDPEDLRDDVTKLTDGLLAAAASIPAWLTRRLDAAFDASFE